MFYKNFKISHKMFIGFGLITIIMLAVLGYSYFSFIQSEEALDLNIETYEVITNTSEIMESMLNIETGARGYALAGKEEFLEPYNRGKLDYEKYFNLVKNSTFDNPNHQERLVRIDESHDNWIEWGNRVLIQGRQDVESGLIELEDLIISTQKGQGKKDMDNIRSIIDEIIYEEEAILAERVKDLNHLKMKTVGVMSIGGLVATILAIFTAVFITGTVVKPVNALRKTFLNISKGEGDYQFRLNVDSNDELGQMSQGFNEFMDKIETVIIENNNENWIKTGQNGLNKKMSGAQDIETLAKSGLEYISKYVGGQIGVMYINDLGDEFKLLSSYAYEKDENSNDSIRYGGGLIVQSALEKKSIIIKDLPKDYLKISSGLGESTPKNILITPCIYDNQADIVIEIGKFSEFTDLELEFIERISEIIGVSVHSIMAKNRMEELLEKTLEQSEELQTQQEELRQSNEELEEQAKALKQSEAELQTQQEELRVTNEELEERGKALLIEKNNILTKNENLKNAKIEIEEKAMAIQKTSKYKSEFLANMSHELRTPLNSILVLSQILGEKDTNTRLTEKYLEYANTIHSSGQDLLKLINDVLDLSKVEAGKMEVNLEAINLKELSEYVERYFKHIGIEKGIDLKVELGNGLPETIVSDLSRLQQILKNLLSNAFKFTDSGQVVFSIIRAKEEGFICISIKDSGIGIPGEKQADIFDAFKQSDGTTSRKYGGTGLGLSISKELATLLRGEIHLESEEGKGSVFSLKIPEDYNGLDENKAIGLSEEKERQADINDDRRSIKEGDKIVLIIEDDYNFSKTLYELANDKGYKTLIGEDGKSGIDLAKIYKPDAILLDIGLPDLSGWKVIEELEKNKETKNIPIHVISGREEEDYMENKNKIVSLIKKPASLDKLNRVFTNIEGALSKSFKKLLIIDKDVEESQSISDILGGKGIEITSIDSGQEAFRILNKETFDCIILDLNPKDMTGIEFLRKLSKDKLLNIPVIIYTGEILTQEEERELQRYTERIIIKGARSSQRLIAEANLFLHNIDSKIEEDKIRSIKSNQEKESSLKDKKILIVDDDMRNVFALSSLLEEKGIQIVVGRNGQEAIEKLKQDNSIDLILMDVMMPVMDGYEAMKKIRTELNLKDIPIIALTAKAMKDDREKAINSGANDYLTKPIDVERLISLLRVWLYK